MPGLAGKVAFITGAARGQGRAEALRLARDGADIIAIDIVAPIETSIAPPATPADLAETARLVEDLGRRIVTTQADVRDFDKLKFALDEGVAELGRLDIVIANAGLWSYGLAQELTAEAWKTVIDVDLTGVWHTAKAAIPILKQQGDGGSIILTSSALGLVPSPNVAHYVAAKHGVVGLMRALALELAADNIRVNTVNPTSVNTDLIQNAPTYELFAPELPAAQRTREVIIPRFEALTALGIPWVEPEDVANAIAWLASEEARYVTGVALPIDAGQMLK